MKYLQLNELTAKLFPSEAHGCPIKYPASLSEFIQDPKQKAVALTYGNPKFTDYRRLVCKAIEEYDPGIT